MQDRQNCVDDLAKSYSLYAIYMLFLLESSCVRMGFDNVFLNSIFPETVSMKPIQRSFVLAGISLCLSASEHPNESEDSCSVFAG